MILTRQQFVAIMPNARRLVDQFLDPLNAALAEFQINTPARCSAFLAQLAHESGSFAYMQELASGRDYDGRIDLGNVDPAALAAAAAHGSTPGPFYKGHGPIQITGFFNHLFFGELLGLDLVNDPRQICTPEHGCRAAAAFWRNAPLRPTVDLADVEPSRRLAVWRETERVDLNDLADAGDTRQISSIINTGYRNASRINGLAEREQYLARAQAALQEGSIA